LHDAASCVTRTTVVIDLDRALRAVASALRRPEFLPAVPCPTRADFRNPADILGDVQAHSGCRVPRLRSCRAAPTDGAAGLIDT